jgi:hypothetical protein
MPVNFRQRAASLHQQLAQVRIDAQTADPEELKRLQALAASIQRSLRWYTARAGTRSDVHALRVEVGDHIRTASGT